MRTPCDCKTCKCSTVRECDRRNHTCCLKMDATRRLSDKLLGNSHVELERLRNIEAMRDILRADLEGVRKQLNEERLKNAELHEAIEGLVTDMSLMEARIAELMGVESLDDYGP